MVTRLSQDWDSEIDPAEFLHKVQMTGSSSFIFLPFRQSASARGLEAEARWHYDF